MTDRHRTGAAWPRWLRLLPWLLLPGLVAACAEFTTKHAGVYAALRQGDTALALQELELAGHGSRSRALYLLDKAMILSRQGDHAAANESFESAKQLMQQLAATSITENLTAVTINEATRSYAGQPYEHILVYALKALNYLAMGDVTGARVEVLQADVQLREWASAGDNEGIDASAFVRYVAGVVFEMNGEWSDALIAYRKAYEVMKHNGEQVPLLLQRDLLRLTAYQGLNDEHAKLQEEFGKVDGPDMKALRDQAQLVVVMQQGLVSRMFEQSVFQYSPELNYSLRISVPFYAPQAPVPMAAFSLGGMALHGELIEDVDHLARTNLDARMPGLMLRTLARVVAKKKIAHEAGRDNSFAGFVTDIVGLATEVADTRSWTSLPSAIAIARPVLQPGAYDTPSGRLELTAGQIKLITVYDSAVY